MKMSGLLQSMLVESDGLEMIDQVISLRKKFLGFSASGYSTGTDINGKKFLALVLGGSPEFTFPSEIRSTLMAATLIQSWLESLNHEDFGEEPDTDGSCNFGFSASVGIGVITKDASYPLHAYRSIIFSPKWIVYEQ
jgi:hypothetical protein